MAVKEKQSDSSEDIEWSVENEIQLFNAMNGLKPVGINKYFHMLCIWEKFRAAIHKDVSLKVIWNHLTSMYDLVALDEMEDLPFPSTESDFSLPEQEFAETIKNRKKDELETKKDKTESKDKQKDLKRDKDVKETGKKETNTRESKSGKELEKRKEEPKKVVKETEVKKDKQKDTKENQKKDNSKTIKTRPKSKDDSDDAGIPVKKERKDSESSRSETLKRVATKRPTRQSTDGSAKASSSPRDTPPLKRRRV